MQIVNNTYFLSESQCEKLVASFLDHRDIDIDSKCVISEASDSIAVVINGVIEFFASTRGYHQIKLGYIELLDEDHESFFTYCHSHQMTLTELIETEL